MFGLASRMAATALALAALAAAVPRMGIAETTSFPSFPPGFFTAGYTEKYQLTGSDTGGDTYAVALTETTEPVATFNGQPAIPVRSVLEITNTKTNETIKAATVAYFTPDPGSRMLLGLSDSLGGVSVATSVGVVPPTVAVGASGPIGNYAGTGDSTGQTSIMSWQLQDAGNELAQFVVINNIMYQGAPVSIEQHLYVIDAQGQRRAQTIELSDAITGDAVTLSGNRQDGKGQAAVSPFGANAE